MTIAKNGVGEALPVRREGINSPMPALAAG
jgi:hypothetical protein